MSTEEAKELVEVVLEKLVKWRVLSEDRYGHMSLDQMNDLADAVKEKSEDLS